MNGTVTTWFDGRVQTVPSDDERLAEQERLRVRLHHVANMRRLDIHGRRDYLSAVERKEGSDSAEALREAFRAAWMAERGAPD
jgi:hypothetical protein